MKKISFPILILFASIAYCLMILSTLNHEWEDFQMGFIQGSQSAQETTGEEVYFITVTPKESVLNFPEKIFNVKAQSDVKARYHKLKVILPNDNSLPLKIKVYRAINAVLAFLMLAVYIFIPIQFYRLLGSFRKGVVFDVVNIKRFRKIGVALLFVFLILTLSSTLYYKIETTIFEFSEYDIIKDKIEAVWLVLGLFILIISEMIARGVNMKKEQEFTI